MEIDNSDNSSRRGLRKDAEEWIDAHRDELVRDIIDFCAIPSVKGSYEQGKPFGDGPFDALNYALRLCEKYGFSIQNYSGYVGAADFDPALPRTLDILAHADVVPAGEGWTVTEPFKVVEKDGRLYGRGTSDDKGPMLCALFAMRAIKACGIPLSKGVRLIIGTDEECGSSDIRKYYLEEQPAEMTFSPDAEFPLINIEKGQFHGILSRDFEENAALPRLLSMEAGIALNAVPQKAVLRFEGLPMQEAEEPMRELEKLCGVRCEISGEQEITVYGESAHASTPEGGKNAGLAALILCGKLPLSPSEQLEACEKVLELFPYGVTDGSGLRIAMEDAESHALSCTLDLFSVSETQAEFQFDSRTPLMASEENCYNVAKESAQSAGFSFSIGRKVPPHRVSADSPFVRTLLSAYEAVTGLKGECLAIGGGTYVHDLENGVAFGAILPGIDTRMHGADEFIDIDNLLTATKVYTEAIIRLCGGEGPAKDR